MIQNFKLVLIFLSTLSFTAFIWSILNSFFLEKLPTNYNDFQKDSNFYSIHLEKLFCETKKIKPKKIILPIETLKKIKLKAIFDNGLDGFIIIEDKKNEIFLELNKKYKGYKLIKIGSNSAIFIKNGKQFEIKLVDEKIDGQKFSYLYKTPKHNISTTEETKEIDKKTLIKYVNNPSTIWRNIAINKTSKGYKITYIKKNSIFQTLGLKKGDYILEVNNQKIITDSDAWKIYKNIKNFDEIYIKIKRHNQIKDLSYEIY